MSFFWNRARCRGCGAAISWRYPLVEAGCAAAFVLSWRQAGPGMGFVHTAFFLCCLVALAATDWECRLLPDEITLGGWATGIVLAHWCAPGLGSALGASFGGAGLLSLVSLAYQRWRGRQGLGWGDVKMVGLMGAFLGLQATLVAVFVASLTAALVGLLQAFGVMIGRRRRGRTWRQARRSSALYVARGALPLGVFLAAGAAAAQLWGPALWRAWLGL